MIRSKSSRRKRFPATTKTSRFSGRERWLGALAQSAIRIIVRRRSHTIRLGAFHRLRIRWPPAERPWFRTRTPTTRQVRNSAIPMARLMLNTTTTCVGELVGDVRHSQRRYWLQPHRPNQIFLVGRRPAYPCSRGRHCCELGRSKRRVLTPIRTAVCKGRPLRPSRSTVVRRERVQPRTTRAANSHKQRRAAYMRGSGLVGFNARDLRTIRQAEVTM